MSQQEKETLPEKKRFPIFSFFIALIIIFALMGAIYVAFYPKTPIPFISEETQNTINKVIEKPSELINSVIDIPKPENTSTITDTITDTNTENYNTANEIFEKIINAPQTISENNQEKKQEILQENKLKQEKHANEDKLNEIDIKSLTKQYQQEQSNPNDEFVLEPPKKIKPLESGRRMLTDKEIKEAQKKDKEEKLKKLEELRQNTNTFAEIDNSNIPSNQGAITNYKPEDNLDPVVTLFFLQDLAHYLVDNYKKTTKGKAYLTCTMPKLNQRYGVSLKGLEHEKGRKGVLDYAYHKDMINILYENLYPILLNYMKQEAEAKTFSLGDQKQMFNLYAALCNQYAMAINKITAIPQLSENIQNLIYLEKQLKTEQEYFAENLLGFEQNKATPNLAHNYQENIKNSTIRSEQLRQRLSTAKQELKKYLINYEPSLSKVPHLLELTLWLERRNNQEASNAFASVLSKFSVELQNFYHD